MKKGFLFIKQIFLFFVLVFSSQLLFSQISLTFVSPESNLVDSSNVIVRARVTPGEYEITGVIATIDNRQVSMINIGPYFQGTLSTSGLNIDSTYVLAITATDVLGNQGTVTKNVIVDPPPKINIQFPINHEVASPQLHIKAAANDNSPCEVAVVADFGYPTYQIAFRDTFINSVDTIISLPDSSYQGLSADVKLRVIDSRGQVRDFSRKIYVESSPYLEKVFSTEGIINDFNYGKLLSRSEELGVENGRIADINTGLSSEIPARVSVYSALTPSGAMFLTWNDWQIKDWNNDSLYSLSANGHTSSFNVGGQYAIWNQGFGGRELYLRNTATGTTKLISTIAGNSNNSVSANGSVAYWTSDGAGGNYNIYRYANDTSKQVTTDGLSTYPATDGKLIVYNRTAAIYLYANSTYTPLSSASGSPESDYKVENGFVAYTRPGTLGQKNIWLWDTSGISSQITYFSNSSAINGLAPDGGICFSRNSLRYLYERSSNKFRVISPTGFGKMYYRDSSWYMSIGRVLFKVKPNFINSYYSVKNGNWSDPATWYGNAVPPVGADVTVGNTVTVDIDATCNTLTVKGNAVVTVNAGINLVVLH